MSVQSIITRYRPSDIPDILDRLDAYVGYNPSLKSTSLTGQCMISKKDETTYHYTQTPVQTPVRLYRHNLDEEFDETVPRQITESYEFRYGLSKLQALALLAHTRGVIALPCWRESSPTKKFQDTVILPDVVDGNLLLDICTNCAWHNGSTQTNESSAQSQRRCTALPKKYIHLPRHPDATAFTPYSENPATTYVQWATDVSLQHGKSWIPAISHCAELEGRLNPSLMYLVSKYAYDEYTDKRTVDLMVPKLTTFKESYDTKPMPTLKEQVTTTTRLMLDLQQLFSTIEKGYSWIHDFRPDCVSELVSELRAPQPVDYIIDDICAICIGGYDDGDDVKTRSAGCRHVYHLDCYKQTMAMNITQDCLPLCPGCRAPVAGLVPVVNDVKEHWRTKLRVTLYYAAFETIESKKSALLRLVQEQGVESGEAASLSTLSGCQKYALQLVDILERLWLCESDQTRSECLGRGWRLGKDIEADSINEEWGKRMKVRMPELTSSESTPESCGMGDYLKIFDALGDYLKIFEALEYFTSRGLHKKHPAMSKAQMDIEYPLLSPPSKASTDGWVEVKSRSNRKHLTKPNTQTKWSAIPRLSEMPEFHDRYARRRHGHAPV